MTAADRITGLPVEVALAQDDAGPDGLVPGKPIQLLTWGEIVTRDGRRLRVDRETEGEALLRDAREMQNDLAILVQHGDDPRHGFEAIGWINPKSISGRDDGIWADSVSWTVEAAGAVKRKGLRYVSPRVTGVKGDDGAIRPRRWVEVSATNIPAIDGMAELAASQDSYRSSRLTDPPRAGHQEEADMALSAETMKVLGLADGASPEDIEKAVKTLAEKAAAPAAPPAPAPDAALSQRIAGLEKTLVDFKAGFDSEVQRRVDEKLAVEARNRKLADVTERAVKTGKIPVAAREAFARLAGSDPSAAEALLSALPTLAPVRRVVAATGAQPTVEHDLSSPDGRKDAADAAFALMAKDKSLTFSTALAQVAG